MKVPEGKFISTVKVGEKGQIVIPKGARDLFDINPGDTLLLLADKEQGIAIVQNDGFLDFANAIFEAQKKNRGK
ncbi:MULTISPECIES: AbrB/MazE/SpoVT family DNA-binding domain-containing protein [Clostridium]|nr:MULTISPECIES: AbrB/MazE/SpoVT family DNA-binding domain-containing protein [Clostridium]